MAKRNPLNVGEWSWFNPFSIIEMLGARRNRAATKLLGAWTLGVIGKPTELFGKMIDFTGTKMSHAAGISEAPIKIVTYPLRKISELAMGQARKVGKKAEECPR